MADTRDEQIKELSEELEDRDTRIGQIEGQVQEHDTLMAPFESTTSSPWP
ncbi:hypothetical protein C2845_PM18G07320 [Panicum miliaceum]|uniref:Uncharacterized protein n=1 Tax=Panicum miliaceum TaxID=4540 RepID=A0A3L6PN57_PANMI|nr:hypothetical protein C2845_PM18G07320 [Panicum miliaceum]